MSVKALIHRYHFNLGVFSRKQLDLSCLKRDKEDKKKVHSLPTKHSENI